MVKYLHDDALQNVTAALTDCPVGGRRLNARLEAYTMKRAGTDKKYAAELQSHHLETQDVLDREWSASTTRKTRQRSVSTGDERGALRSGNRRKRSNSLDVPPSRTSSVAAPRSISTSGINYLESAATAPSHTSLLNRRLWTDFILTLNQAFPDYDFAAATASDFHLIPLEAAVARINERLSEVATLLMNNGNAINSASGGANNTTLSRNGITNLLPQLWAAVDAAIHLQSPVQVYEYEGDDDVLRNESNNGDVLWSFHYFFVNKQLKRILLFTCMETIDQQQQYGNGMNNANGMAVDGLLPVVDYYDDEEEEANNITGRCSNLGMTPPPSKLQRRESDSAQSAAYGEDNRSEAPTMMETMAEAAYYDRGDDDDSSSRCSVDFDLDPADAVSGGIPLDHV